MSRPTDLTPEVQAAIVESLRVGNYVETAAAAAGVRKQTVYNWLKRGNDEEEGIYCEFLDAVQKAQAEAEQTLLQRIDSAGEWQAAAWRLERKFPERWGRRAQVELTGKDGGPIKTVALTRDEVDAAAAAAVGAAGDESGEDYD